MCRCVFGRVIEREEDAGEGRRRFYFEREQMLAVDKTVNHCYGSDIAATCISWPPVANSLIACDWSLQAKKESSFQRQIRDWDQEEGGT